MAYKIERVTDLLLVIKSAHWWHDLSSKDVIAALAEISLEGKITSVCRVGRSSPQYVVVIEKK